MPSLEALAGIVSNHGESIAANTVRIDSLEKQEGYNRSAIDKMNSKLDYILLAALGGTLLALLNIVGKKVGLL